MWGLSAASPCTSVAGTSDSPLFTKFPTAWRDSLCENWRRSLSSYYCKQAQFQLPFLTDCLENAEGEGGGGVVHITRTASLCILERKLLPSEGVRPESLDNVDCDGFIKGQFSRMSSCCVVNSKKLETNIFPNISKFCLSHRTTCLWLELLSTLILVDDLYL